MDMDNYTIDSKLYVTPNKVQLIIKMILNIAIVLQSVYTIYVTVSRGFNIIVVTSLGLAVVIVFGINSSFKAKYEFAILDIEVDSEKAIFCYHNISVGFYRGDYRYEIKRDSVANIEYSKQLNALRLAGEFVRYAKNNCESVNELVVYSSDETNKIINSIETRFEFKVNVLE